MKGAGPREPSASRAPSSPRAEEHILFAPPDAEPRPLASGPQCSRANEHLPLVSKEGGVLRVPLTETSLRVPSVSRTPASQL